MTAPRPYFDDGQVQLFVGDCREVIPALGLKADLVLADPPYGETKLAWDKWPDGWLDAAASASRSLWCFGSLRMFLARADEFGAWKLSQDVVWEKHNGSGFDTDRFKRVHEVAAHWYRGTWSDIYRKVPTTAVSERSRTRGAVRATGDHRGTIAGTDYTYDGTRLERSVIAVRSMHGRALHPTEKPLGILLPLISYGCPPVASSSTRSREAAAPSMPPGSQAGARSGSRRTSGTPNGPPAGSPRAFWRRHDVRPAPEAGEP